MNLVSNRKNAILWILQSGKLIYCSVVLKNYAHKQDNIYLASGPVDQQIQEMALIILCISVVSYFALALGQELVFSCKK